MNVKTKKKNKRFVALKKYYQKKIFFQFLFNYKVIIVLNYKKISNKQPRTLL